MFVPSLDSGEVNYIHIFAIQTKSNSIFLTFLLSIIPQIICSFIFTMSESQ